LSGLRQSCGGFELFDDRVWVVLLQEALPLDRLKGDGFVDMHPTVTVQVDEGLRVVASAFHETQAVVLPATGMRFNEAQLGMTSDEFAGNPA
jgi:hypothetical protein